MINSNMNQKRGSALVIGMIAVLAISGLVVAYHRLSLAGQKNIYSFANHQTALYTSHSGIVRSQYLLISNHDVTINDVTDTFLNHVSDVGDNYSLQGKSGDGNYLVTITRISAADVEPQDLNPQEFNIDDGSIIPTVEYDANFKVIGAEFGYSNGSPLPITADIQVDGVWQKPWGNPQSTSGNINDDWGPLATTDFSISNVAADVPINLMLQSWTSGPYMTAYSNVEATQSSPQILVLRNGDVPQWFDPAYPDQTPIIELLADYIDPTSGTIVLEDNQVIYLSELGTSNPNSSAWDMQDAVILVSLSEAGSGETSVPSEDVGYTATSKNNGKAVMYSNPSDPLGDNGVKKTDTFEMTVTDANGGVTVSTWVDGVRINTTMTGEVGETVIDENGFEITIVSINGNVYTVSVSSVSNSNALQKVKFHYGSGARVTGGTTVIRTDYLIEQESSSLGYFEVISTGYFNSKKFTFKGVINLVEDLDNPDSGQPLLIQRRPITNTDEESIHLANFE